MHTIVAKSSQHDLSLIATSYMQTNERYLLFCYYRPNTLFYLRITRFSFLMLTYRMAISIYDGVRNSNRQYCIHTCVKNDKLPIEWWFSCWFIFANINESHNFIFLLLFDHSPYIIWACESCVRLVYFFLISFTTWSHYRWIYLQTSVHFLFYQLQFKWIWSKTGFVVFFMCFFLCVCVKKKTIFLI